MVDLRKEPPDDVYGGLQVLFAEILSDKLLWQSGPTIGTIISLEVG